MSTIADVHFYTWGELLLPHNRRVLSSDHVLSNSSNAWVNPLRASLVSGMPIERVFTEVLPDAVGVERSIISVLGNIPELANLLSLVTQVYLGYRTTDVEREQPAIGLVFDENRDLFLVVNGPTIPLTTLPSELQALQATMGAWQHIYLPPLSNFLWFLDGEKMQNSRAANTLLYSLLGMGEITMADVRDSNSLLLEEWPPPETCTVIGEVADGDALLLIREGLFDGCIFVASHDGPGLFNHLPQKDYLSWLRWMLGFSILTVKGGTPKRPWFY